MNQIIPEIVSQHAEEAAFLWQLREQAIIAPHYHLSDLTKLDLRLEAHLDGLRVAGEPAWDILLSQLEANPGPGETFAAAWFAYELGQEPWIEKVLQVASPVPALRRAFISALGWLPQSEVQRHLPSLLSSVAAERRHIGLGAALAHRLNPGAMLEKCLQGQDLLLRAYALRVVGIMGFAAWKSLLTRELRSSDLGCRLAAAWSLCRLAHDTAALAELQTIALADSRWRTAAVNMAVRRLDIPASRKLIQLLLRVPDSQRIAVFAAGALGDPAEIPLLLDQMANPATARVAGEAFSWMTGVHLAYDKLEADPPEGFEAVPNENPLDERVDLDPDEHLAWPDAGKLRSWWKLNAHRFPTGVRHLMGKPLTRENLPEVLRTGNQRQRAAAALEQGLFNPTTPLLEIRAPGFRQ